MAPLFAAAVIASGAAMLVLAVGATEFLKRSRMFEALGLSIRLTVGVALFLVEFVQSMYQRRLGKAARTQPFRAASDGLQLE